MRNLFLSCIRPGNDRNRRDAHAPPDTGVPPDHPVPGTSSQRPPVRGNPRKALLLQIAEVDAWIKSGNDNERDERKQVGAQFKNCLSNPNETSLEIKDCDCLTSLPPWPAKLTSLTLSRCRNLPAIPDLSSCKALKTMTVKYCDQLAALPVLAQCEQLDGLELKGLGLLTTLDDMSQCKALKTLSVIACHQLVSIAGLSQCEQLEHVDLRCLESLTSLANLTPCKALNTLWVMECPSLAALRDLSQCEQLKDVELYGLRSLTALEGLSECKKMERLQLSGLHVFTALLDFSQLGQLEKLGLYDLPAITGPLNFSACSVLNDVTLFGCPGLTSLPPLGHLTQLRRLDVRGLALTSLPDDILTLDRRCEIEINASRFSDAVRNRLVATLNPSPPMTYEGPRISYQMAELAAHGPDIKVGTLDQEVERWREEAAPRAVTALDPAVWKEIPAQDNASYFAKFLVRVRETNDYLHATPALKVATQQRVAALLTQLQSDPALRDNCFNLAFDATETCGDRVALRLLDMEMACLASRTTAEIASGKYDRNPQPLVDLCKGQYRLQVLTRLAKEKVATLHFVDEIEVHLGYLVELAESHPLPTQVATMLYPACSCITSDDIAAAKSQLGNDGLSDIAAEKNNQDFQAFLAASPLMHSLLGRVREAEMTALNGDIQQQIAHEKNVIQDQLDHLDPASSGYGDECKQLMKQYNALDTVIPAGAIRSVLMPVLAQGGVNAGL